jgi:hypothetical protein
LQQREAGRGTAAFEGPNRGEQSRKLSGTSANPDHMR